MRSWILMAASIAVLACGTSAFAQNTDQPARQPRGGQAPDAAAQPNDAANAQQGKKVAELAGWLASCNHAEIEISKLAQQRAQNEQVKQFAQRMVEEHTSLQNELRKFAPNIDAQDPSERPSARDNVTDRRDTPSARPAPREGQPAARDTAVASAPDQTAGKGHGDMMKIGMKAGKLKLSLTKQLLEDYQGQNFDMGYLGQQTIAHIEMLATLSAMQGHGTPEFQQLLDRSIEKTQGHLKQARVLAMQLEDNEAGTEPAAEPARRGAAPRQ